MNISEILYIVKKDEVGKKLIALAKAISENDKKTLINSRCGERLYIEFTYSGFWEKLEYLPQLSLLEYIDKNADLDINPAKEEERHKLTANAGDLNEILYGN